MLSTDHIRGRLTGLHPSVDPGLPSRKLTPIASVACANSVEMSDVACGSPVALPLARVLFAWLFFACFPFLNS